MSHTARARAALARMPEIDPAVSALALWCVHRDGAGATASQGAVITYGPEFVALPLAEQTGVVAHHVLHGALCHSARAAQMAERMGDGFDPALYNLVSDAIVNEVLLQGGHALPRPAVRAAELIASVPGLETKGDVLSTWDTDRLYLAIAGGSAAGRRAAQDYGTSRGFAPDLSPEAEVEEQGAVWRGRVEQAALTGAGQGIGVVLARLADRPQAQVPWEQELRRLLARAVSEVPRRSDKRPAHGWIAREALARAAGGPVPVFEPGLARDARRPRVAIGVDTSSSITDGQLALMGAEAEALTRRLGAEVHVLGFDVAVHTRFRLDRRADLSGLALRRGGGTGFGDVVAEAQALDPAILVIFTDLEGPTGPAPKVPVVWAVPRAPAPEAPFGRVLSIDG